MLRRTFSKALTFITLLLTLVVFMAPVGTASAAGDGLTMKNLDFQVWPEYDDPRILHILNGTLVNTSGQEVSGSVKFNIPKGADIKMACELVNGTEHSCQPYEISDKGDYAEITWKITKKLAPGQEYPFWLEYYYNPLNNGPAERNIDFTFRPTYDISQLKMTFKEPLQATNFKSTPQPTSSGKDGENFTTHYYDLKGLTTAKPVDFKFSYNRTATEPSVKKQDPSANQTNASASEPLGTSAWKKPEVLIPSGLFVIVLAVFIYYAMNNSSKQNTMQRVERIRQQSSSKKAAPPTSSNPKLAKEKKKIRQMLLNGDISEDTYRELIAELEEDLS